MAKYDVTVSLLGEDGNAFVVIGKVKRALRKARVSDDEIAKYWEEATSGDYDHLLRTTMEWVEVE